MSGLRRSGSAFRGFRSGAEEQSVERRVERLPIVRSADVTLSGTPLSLGDERGIQRLELPAGPP